MSPEVIAAVVAAFGTIVAAALTVLLSSRKESKPKTSKKIGDRDQKMARRETTRAAAVLANHGELQHGPLLGQDSDHAAEEITLVSNPALEPFLEETEEETSIQVIVESAHSGERSSKEISLRASFAWLLDWAEKELGVRRQADVGAFRPFELRWVLVDKKAEATWSSLEWNRKMRAIALVKKDESVLIIENSNLSLGDAGVNADIVFHLHGISGFEDVAMTADGGAGN